MATRFSGGGSRSTRREPPTLGKHHLEQTPSDWQKGIIIPIHKSASIYDLNNYRGITLTSNVYKIYASIMENTIMTFLEDKNVLGESQGAFRKNKRPEDHLFTLNGICSQRKSSKLKTYTSFP